MNTIATILLQTAQQGPGMMINLVFLAGIFAVFYFFIIRPQQKRQQDEKKFQEGLKKDDQVVTIGGIFGKIVRLEDNAAIVQVDENTKIKVLKSALRAAGEPAETKK